MWNGGLGTRRERCCRDQKKKTKMRVGVDIIFVQKLTEVYSN